MLQPFLPHAAKDHRSQAAIADRQGLDPNLGRLLVPQSHWIVHLASFGPPTTAQIEHMIPRSAQMPNPPTAVTSLFDKGIESAYTCELDSDSNVKTQGGKV